MKGVLECVWKSIQCPCFEFAQKSFYLRPKFFNGIQIRTIRWKMSSSSRGWNWNGIGRRMMQENEFRYNTMYRLPRVWMLINRETSPKV